MDNQKDTKSLRRQELQKRFLKGRILMESDFASLIDSFVVKEDDGFAKDYKNGLHLSLSGSSRRFATWFDSKAELNPAFYIDRYSGDGPGLKLEVPALSRENGDDGVDNDLNCLFLQQEGRMGIGKKTDPRLKLDVKGWVGMEGRIGTKDGCKIAGIVKADGKYHDIINRLDNCNSFEVVARTSEKYKKKVSLLYAIANCAYGGSGGSIRKTGTHIGFFRQQLKLRWSGSPHNYSIQIRTRSNLGDGALIHYTFTQLWGDSEMGIPNL